MFNEKQDTEPTKYIIRIKNHLNSHWEKWFKGMTITNMEGGEMIISGEVADQCALHGLLEKIRNLNLTLISARKVDPGAERAATICYEAEYRP